MKTILSLATVLIIYSGTRLYINEAIHPPHHSKTAPNKIKKLAPVLKTLNGFDYPTANNMINYFADHDNYRKDIGKKSIYTWYNLDQIGKIDALINFETGRISGIRIYFGSENDPPPVNPISSKLNVHLFLVSTRKRISSDPKGDGSPEIDYYDHTADYLTQSNVTFGDAIHEQAMMGLSQGAELYDTKNPPKPDVCNKPSEHYINSVKAYNWVQQREETAGSTDPSGYNMRSEWFDICFIKGLFQALLSKSNNFSGLRVYLGKGYQDPSDAADSPRDVFILVPTQTLKDVSGNPIKDPQGNPIERDYYQCVEDLPGFPTCDSLSFTDHLIRNKISREIFEEHIRHYGYFYAAYDEGELCPNSCN